MSTSVHPDSYCNVAPWNNLFAHDWMFNAGLPSMCAWCSATVAVPEENNETNEFDSADEEIGLADAMAGRPFDTRQTPAWMKGWRSQWQGMTTEELRTKMPLTVDGPW